MYHKLSKTIQRRSLGFVGGVVSMAVLAVTHAPAAQAQDGDNCCSGTIDCEPSFTPQLPPDCLELRDQAYREEQERYYARWDEIQEWEETTLKNSDQIYRDTI